MTSFEAFSKIFNDRFNTRHFPVHTSSLYDPAQYILSIPGKHIRPVCVYLANELFSEPNDDAFNAAASIELFHNFSLIHDDIMDKAPLRRGLQTVHEKWGNNTALLAGDVMFVTAYEYLSRISKNYLPESIVIFNRTAKQVCEGQQLDMDFEKADHVSFDEYLNMITLKTSVLVAASLEMGALLGGAGAGNRENLYRFGKNLGIAFQLQDDWLDAFGDETKTGKQRGGDILANKKTFLLISALENCSDTQRVELRELMSTSSADKVDRVLQIFESCGAAGRTASLKDFYFNKALEHLEKVAVLSGRKNVLEELAFSLLNREK